ncbi:Enoyl-[acyl-carrier-protein] reductase [Actinokineospora spheciospongiae]|uniref:Propionate 3-nitronate monooxygenase n=1 Tax=Actinokineospora spheciospongiae TaxID=909613 RepID=W7IGX9_9PSEU|nr:nitronate monooxygenase [Actinokineospora spheciospongiae]EWC60130.1 Enoyl-[acyl-carrier-protein] reductase [Actinokineospora spheciospongiae]
MIAETRIPVVVAPMAGGPTTPELVVAAAEAGAFGFLAAALVTPDRLRALIAETRRGTTGPFGVNIFTLSRESAADVDSYRDRVLADAERYGVLLGDPDWDDDHYAAKVDVVVEERVPVVSFTFGLPRPTDVERLRAAGTQVVITVTTPAEARAAAAAGADVLCVQGPAAGGHRSVFTDDPAHPSGAPAYDLLPLLRLVAAETDLPLIAAGGLVHGADIAAVLAAGAVAAQLGTAFLRSPEAGTSRAHRTALAAADRETTVTRAFSGRPARGLVNQFITDHGAAAPAAYPNVNNLTKPLRAASTAADDPESMSLWAGQSYPLAREAPTAEILATLMAQAREAVAALTARFPA